MGKQPARRRRRPAGRDASDGQLLPAFTPSRTSSTSTASSSISGPNSILFGVGNLGGVISSYTKKPVFNKDFTELDLVVTSYGGARATLDVNQMASILHKDDLGVRVNLMADRDESWRKADEIKRWGAARGEHIQDLRARSRSVRFDVEAYEVILPQYAENMSDEYSQWNGQTEFPDLGRRPVRPVELLPVHGGMGRPELLPALDSVRGHADELGRRIPRHRAGGRAVLHELRPEALCLCPPEPGLLARGHRDRDCAGASEHATSRSGRRTAPTRSSTTRSPPTSTRRSTPTASSSCPPTASRTPRCPRISSPRPASRWTSTSSCPTACRTPSSGSSTPTCSWTSRSRITA